MAPLIPTLGLIVAVYAIARLIQVPLESWGTKQRWWLVAVSLPAILIIAILAISLLLSGVSNPALTERDSTAESSTAAAFADDQAWRATLKDHIVNAGHRCPTLTDASHRGVAADGFNLWTASCTTGRYEVSFKTGATPRVRQVSR